MVNKSKLVLWEDYHPKYLKDILGKKANKDISFGSPLKWQDVDYIASSIS